ncbi:MAG: hypothetical protein AAGF67_09340 [Verrucomicrobiota bacterium]
MVCLLLPAFTGRTGNPSGHAANTAYNLKNAITTYFTEYRKYPLETEMADLTTLTGEELMSVLMGSENEAALQRNPRKMAFFSDRPAKHVDGKYIKGVQMEKGERYFLLDTWGNQYLVRMDTNYDNRVSSPEDPTQLLPEAVIVWSAGPDGDFSTWDDNVKTW